MPLQNGGSHRGSVLGGSLLIAGSCIGAGMLALPIKTGLTGFYPFLLVFLLCWAFMTVTGLLLLEVNLWFGSSVSIISMSERTLGIIGKVLSWVIFCFLFYSLMVAYLAGCGTILTDVLYHFTGIHCPRWVAVFFAMLFFGGFIYFGARAVDNCNRVFMLGLVITYVILVFLGLGQVQGHFMVYCYWSKAFLALPVMIIMFGYHNLIPTLTAYLKCNTRKLILTIVIGSVISFFICLLWEWIVVGIVPAEGEQGLIAAEAKGTIASTVLLKFLGSGWTAIIAQAFALCAVITSCLGVALSFIDFLADGLKVQKTGRGTILLCSIVMVPAFICSLSSPKIFSTAIEYAGGFATVIIFGIFPALMVWIGRYRKKIATTIIMPGGRITLVCVILVSIGIFLLECAQECGWIAFASINEIAP